MLPTSVIVTITIFSGLVILITLMFVLVKWARTRSGAALATGALLATFAPDPTLERNIRLAEQAKTVQMEEDEEGGE